MWRFFFKLLYCKFLKICLQVVHTKGLHAKVNTFFEIFFILFLFTKQGKNDHHGYSYQRVEYFKTISGCLYNEYFCTLTWFLEIVSIKRSHTYSLNFNLFREIDENSFRWAKIARKLEKSWIPKLHWKYGLLCVKIGVVPFCAIFFVFS